jgi:toxin FitB
VTGWLLDTNILSELRRPKPEHKVLAFVAAQPLDLLYVSSATIAEIRFGIELVGDANRRAELNDWLAHKVRPMFEQRILAITEDIMFKWRLLVEDGRKAGHTFSQPDLIIAATALQHGLTVVSRDASDYQKARAPVLIRGSIRRRRAPHDGHTFASALSVVSPGRESVAGLARATKSRRVDSWLFQLRHVCGTTQRLCGSTANPADDNTRSGSQGVEETAFTGCAWSSSRAMSVTTYN